MNLISFGVLIMITLNMAYSRSRDKLEDDRLNEKQFDMIQERMEEGPPSTPIGGSLGGRLEEERSDKKLKSKGKVRRPLPTKSNK